MGRYETITQTSFTMKELAALIDHSLLSPFISQKDIDAFIDEVKDYHFKVAAVNNSYIEYCANKLAGTGAVVDAAVSFPFGVLSPDAKASEIEFAIKKGAGEIDAVCNIGAVKSADWELLYRDMASCVEVAHKHGLIIKTVIETCYLTADEKIKTCEIAKKAGMDYVKTSTGFGTGGIVSIATLGDVKLMKRTVGEDMRVKASGPIADYDTAVALINAGAHRLGSRKGVDILKGCSDYRG
jgi:deoxyribose-phosphate aldolase